MLSSLYKILIILYIIWTITVLNSLGLLNDCGSLFHSKICRTISRYFPKSEFTRIKAEANSAILHSIINGVSNKMDITEISGKNLYDSSSYRMLRDTDRLFSKYHIEYIAINSTLLGAVAYRNMMPMDSHDIKIAINEKDLSKLDDQKVRKDFAALGYSIMSYGLLRSVVQDNYQISNPISNNNSGGIESKRKNGGLFFAGGLIGASASKIDISLIKHTSDGNFAIFNPFSGSSSQNSEKSQINKKDLYPIRKAAIGPLLIPIPNHPERYLNNNYPNWQKMSNPLDSKRCYCF